jgi:hypothetical protein
MNNSKHKVALSVGQEAMEVKVSQDSRDSMISSDKEANRVDAPDKTLSAIFSKNSRNSLEAAAQVDRQEAHLERHNNKQKDRT